MKSLLPILSLVIVFASCSTAYKTGQTPDDVYFSPQHQQDEYVRVDNNNDRSRYKAQDEDDRYLRMKVRNRQVWSDLDYYYSDPFAYRYYNSISPYYYSSPYSYSSPWSYYNSWNYYYNPYSSKNIVVNQKNPSANVPRMTNLNVYNDVPGNSSDRQISPGKIRVFGNASNSNNSSSSSRNSSNGGDLRNVFGNSNNNSNSSSTNNAPVRTTTNSSSNSNSSSGSNSSGSTNAPVRKF
ncbi:MAG: hypothetical protein ABIN57_06635 [Chitinophagaceae bacterium]